jgi:hypothetical protein
MSETTAGSGSLRLWNATSSCPSVGALTTGGILGFQVLTLMVPHQVRVVAPLTLIKSPVAQVRSYDREQARGEALLRLYARRFDQSFAPYDGPDEPARFEPEDFPVR